MKKILLGCTAASVLLGGIVFISAYQMPLAQKQALLTASSPSSSSTLNAKMYTLEEEQILSAAETFLYYQNLDELIRVDVKADGNDFIITFENPNDKEEPKHDLRLVRIADFNGKKQYKITSESWVNWAEIVRVNFPNPQITIDEYTHTISWVPDLSLMTNSSLKATDIIIKDTDLSLSIGSIIADSMVAPQNNKMDVASISDVLDINIKTPMFELTIPKISYDTQITGTDQTGIEIMQALSAEKTTASLMIPAFAITSPLLGTEPITGTIEDSVIFDDHLNISMRISDIKVPNMPTLPTTINANVSLNGLEKSDIISYMQLSEKYEELENPETPEGADLEKQLFDLYNQLAQKISINVEDISLIFKEGTIAVSGTIKPEKTAVAINGEIRVVNFDALSPAPQPADKEACAKALEQMTPDMPMPAACVQQPGMLEFLRPFLDTTKRTTNTEGQSVDTFKIDYSANKISINGQEILMPQTQSPAPTQNIRIENIQVKSDKPANGETPAATLSEAQVK